jgi:hypothetical protein
MRGLGLIEEFGFGINYGVGETMLKVTFFELFISNEIRMQ